MPTINESLIPTVNPGGLVSRLTTDSSLNIRWLVSVDPAQWEVLNRPIADTVFRQLVLAKTLDGISLSIGRQQLFPFLIQPRVIGGSGEVDVPNSWIFDMSVSLPAKWENIRLAKIQRISGVNDGGSDSLIEYTGALRLFFAANLEGGTTETYLFKVDYDIDSNLTYQKARVAIVTASDQTVVLPTTESETVDGFVTFRTLDYTESPVADFLQAVAPPIGGTDSDSDGEFDSPSEYDLADAAAGGASEPNDYTLAGLAHGTGLLLDGATNPVPPADADVNVWINTFNYPWDAEATLQSSSHTGISIPQGLFREFNLVAPSSDEPTGDTSGDFYPVYISRITRDDAGADQITIYFATYNVETSSIVPIEFATLVLQRTDVSDAIIGINPIENLWVNHAGDNNFLQGFGTGHVVLSSTWSDSGSVITDFFDSFIGITGSPASATFSKAATRVSSFGLSRVPDTVLTVGQAEAARGSKAGVAEPNSTNRYVVESDRGLGSSVDFINEGLSAVTGIERTGWTGGVTHRAVYLKVDSDASFDYATDILPRLRLLFGRDPEFSDIWYDGTRFKFYNGDSWVA